MKKFALKTLIVVLVGALPFPASAQTVVSSVAQLRAAVASATSGGPADIRIKAGTYNLDAMLELSVGLGVTATLRNYGDGQVILTRSGGSILRTGFVTRKGSYVIKGLTFSRGGIAIESDGGDIRIEASTFVENDLAFYTDSSNTNVTIVNSTFWANGTYCSGFCGAIWLDLHKSAQITNSAIVGTIGPGIYGLDTFNGLGPEVLANSIVVSNLQDCQFSGGTTIVNSIDSDGMCSSETSQATTYAVGLDVAGYGDNGGLVPTWPATTPLKPNPVIQMGEPAYCPAYDARGGIRHAPCDIGAFESTSSFQLDSAIDAGAVSFYIGSTATNFHAIDPSRVPQDNLPAGVTFPFGLFDWVAVGLVPGQSLPVTIGFSVPIATPLHYWKFDPVSTQWSDLCQQVVCTQPSPNGLSFTITDGGPGDLDGIADGKIVDPGGLGVGGDRPPAPNVALTKIIASPVATVGNGAIVTYRLAASNLGAGPTTDRITVTDPLDLKLTFLAAGSDPRCTPAGPLVTCIADGPLDPGSTDTFDLSVQVSADAAAAGASVQIINTASAATLNDSNPNDDASTVTLTVNGPLLAPNLSITKDVSAGSVNTDESLRYRLTVMNHGNGPTTASIEVRDTLDARLTFIAALSDSRCSVGQNQQQVTCIAAGPLASGSTTAFDLSVAVRTDAAPAGGSVVISNIASVVTADDSNQNDDVSNAVMVTVNGRSPNLAITKDFVPGHLPVNRTLNNGDATRYRLTLINNGNGSTTAPIVVTDILDARLSFVAAGSDPRCVAAGQQITCTSNDLWTPGVQDNFDISVQVAVNAAALDATVQIENTATVSTAGDSIAADNHSNTVVFTVQGPHQPNLTLSQVIMANGQVQQPVANNGDTITYRLSTTNIGSASTTAAIVITDNLDPRLSFVAPGSDPRCSAAGQTITCSSPLALGQGGVEVFDVRVHIAANAASPDNSVFISNTASVSTLNDSNPADDSSTLVLTVHGPPAPNMTIAKQFVTGSPQQSANNGDVVIYRLRAQNISTGPTTAAVTVTDTLDARLNFVGAGSDPRCSAAGQVVTCVAGGPLQSFEQVIFDIAVQVGSDAAPFNGFVQISNTATVSTPDDHDPSNDISNPALLTVNGPRPPSTRVSKFFLVGTNELVGPITVDQGATVAYQLRVTNLGAGPTTGSTVVTDTLDSRLNFVAESSDPRCSAAGQVITCVTSGVIPGDLGIDNFRIAVQVSPNIVPTGSPIQIFNSATISTPHDADLSDNTSNTVALNVKLGAVTPAGNSVTVQPTNDLGVPQPIRLTFSSVTSAGVTTANLAPVGPALPSNYLLKGQVFDITTTAQYTPPVTMCFIGNFLPVDRLLHYENGNWVQLPDQQLLPSGGPFTQLCAVTSSLSPFAVASVIDTEHHAPTLTRITPDSGKRGTFEVVIFRGTGLRAKKLAVKFSGDGINVIEEVSLNATTAAALIYIKPNAVRGSRAVTVSTAFGTSNPVTFVVK